MLGTLLRNKSTVSPVKLLVRIPRGARRGARCKCPRPVDGLSLALELGPFANAPQELVDGNGTSTEAPAAARPFAC